jgi:hypothetical protein
MYLAKMICEDMNYGIKVGREMLKIDLAQKNIVPIALR